MSKVSKPEAVQVEGKESKRGRAVNSPKVSQSAWNKVKIDYSLQNFTSLKELSDRHGIDYQVLRSKVYREKWNEEQSALQRKVSLQVEKKVITLAERQSDYLLRLSKRGEKYERIIDASMDQLGSKDANGTPLLDPEAIDQFTRSEARVMELNRVSLKIPTNSQLEHTSGGVGLVQSFVSAISKLRQDQASPKLNDGDVDRIIEAGIE